MNSNPIQSMYAVEHAYSDGRQTYDIFPTKEAATAFCGNAGNWTDTHIPLFMFKADFNVDLIYFDEQLNGWNYEDFADTIIGNYTIIQIYNAA
ncbi:MAG: hypothetical protein PWQ65_955 [Bacteroidota bacterium]|nr:hypothetical protein [Bacteroidota bacterium]